MAIAQQDQTISQFHLSQLVFNPAYAGENDHTRVTALHRDQWAGLQGSPTMQLVSINFAPVFTSLGFGVSLRRQSIGIQEKIDIAGSYAYRVKINKNTLSVAMQVSAQRFTNDFTQEGLIAIDGFALDPAIERIKYHQNVFNAGIGLRLKGQQYHLGIAIPRLVRADLNEEIGITQGTEVRHIYVNGGLNLELSDNVKFMPQALYRLTEGGPADLDLMALLEFQKRFVAGINLRTGGTQESFAESIDLIAGFAFNERIFASVAFDFTLTPLRRYENGSFELVLQYRFLNNYKPNFIHSQRYY